MRTLLAAISLSVLSIFPSSIALADDQWPPAQYVPLQESQVHLITNKFWSHTEIGQSSYTEETWIFLPFDSRLNDTSWLDGADGNYGLLIITGGTTHPHDQTLNFWNLNPDGTIQVTDPGADIAIISISNSANVGEMVVRTSRDGVTREMTFLEYIEPSTLEIDGEMN